MGHFMVKGKWDQEKWIKGGEVGVCVVCLNTGSMGKASPWLGGGYRDGENRHCKRKQGLRDSGRSWTLEKAEAVLWCEEAGAHMQGLALVKSRRFLCSRTRGWVTAEADSGDWWEWRWVRIRMTSSHLFSPWSVVGSCKSEMKGVEANEERGLGVKSYERITEVSYRHFQVLLG